MRILDPHRAPLDPQYPIRGVAELEHIALQALDREVLIDRAHQMTFRLQHDPVVGVVRNGAARGDRRESGALARTQHLIDRVVMQQRCAAPAARAEALRQHVHALVEFFAPQCAVGIRAAHQREQLILGAFARRHLGGDLLRQHVERVLRNGQAIQLAAAHRIEQRRALHQFVARRGKQPALWKCRPTEWPARPTRCRKALMERVEPIWQTRSTSPMSMPSSSEAVATSTFSSPRFSRCSASKRRSLARLP